MPGAAGDIFGIGHASGPILVGLLIARLDYFPAFLIMAALLIAATPVFLLLVDLQPPPAASTPNN